MSDDHNAATSQFANAQWYCPGCDSKWFQDELVGEIENLCPDCGTVVGTYGDYHE